MPTEQQSQSQNQQNNAAGSKQPSKHGHAASQTQPTPRKVRFNVGSYFLYPFLRSTSCSPSTLHRFPIPGPRCCRRRCLRYRLFCCPSSNRQKGCDQEDRSLRPLNVLPEDSSGAQAAQIPQRGRCMRKREPLISYIRPYPSAHALVPDHLDSGYHQTPFDRGFQRGLL